MIQRSRPARSSAIAAGRAGHAQRLRRARGARLFHRHPHRSRGDRATRPDGSTMSRTSIESAIGGENVTQTVEGRERYPVNVRYERGFRDDLPALERVLVKTPAGRAGAARAARRDRAHAGSGDDPRRGRPARRLRLRRHRDARHRRLRRRGARRAIAEQLQLPAGYTLQWTGQYEFQVARARAAAASSSRSCSSSSSCCCT